MISYPMPKILTTRGNTCYILTIPQLRFGSTLSSHENGLLASIMKCSNISSQWFLGEEAGRYTCQIPTKQDLKELGLHLHKTGKNYYIHCPFAINLAKEDSEYDKKMLLRQLSSVTGVSGSCVLHVGKGNDIHKVSERLNDIMYDIPRGVTLRNNDSLLLEVAAGQGTELGKTWEEFRGLYEGIDYSKIGICVDTQHIFASGMCSFDNHESVVNMLQDMYDIIGKDVAMIHLNDSKKQYNTRVDRHAPLGQGYIWNRDIESLKSLVIISKDMNIDLISETSDPINDYAFIKKILHS